MSPFSKVKKFPPLHYYLLAWNRCSDYKGVSSRSELWWALLGIFIVNMIAASLMAAIIISNQAHAGSGVSLATVIISIGYIQTIPLSIRRLRDCGILKNKTTDLFFYFLLLFSSLKFPGNSLLTLVKLIAGLTLFVMFMQPSNYVLEENKKGQQDE